MLRRLFGGRPPRGRRGPSIEVDTAIYAGGKYYTALLLELVNKPGVVARIVDEIAKRRINIVKVTTPYLVTGDRGHLLIILEDCDEKCAGELKRVLEGMREIVLAVEAASGMDIFLFPKLGELRFLNERGLVLSAGMVAEALRTVSRSVGRAEHSGVLRFAGKGVGRYVYQGVYSLMSAPQSPEAQLKLSLDFLVDMFKALGLGDAEYDLRGLEVRFKVRDNFECAAAKEAGLIGPAGDFTSGLIEGFLEGVFGRRVEVVEEKCIARGDNHCEFRAMMYEAIPG